jgi:hypothetical protein
MIKQITIPIEHESYMDEVLKEMALTCDKKPLQSSAYYPEPDTNKKSKSYLMYDIKVNETLAYVIGMKVERKMIESLNS